MGEKWSLFEKFLITENVNLSITDFLISSVLVVILSWLLSMTYQKVARSLSNRKDFAANFVLLAFTTMLIITIVKSSLALSLGLVGALSIVRFRSAIKEPEELAYFFIAISIGLGLGANQAYIVLVAFGVIMVVLWGRFFIGRKNDKQNLFLVLKSENQQVNLSEVQTILNKYFKRLELKRFDENSGLMEISFLAEGIEFSKLESLRNEVKQSFPQINFSFLDSKSY